MLEKKIKYSLTSKFLIGLVVMSTLPVILFSVLTNLFISKIISNYVKETADSNLESVVHNFENQLVSSYSSLLALKNDEELIELIATDEPPINRTNIIYQKLYLVTGKKPNELSIYVIDKDGSYGVGTTSIPHRYNLSLYNNWGIFRKLRDEKEPLIFPNMYENPNGRIILSLAARLEKDNEVIGYIIIDVHEDVLKDVFNTSSKNSFEYLVASKDNLVIYNNTVKVLKNNFFDEEINELFELAKRKEYYKTENSDYYVNTMELDEFPFIFMSMQNMNFINSISSNLYKITVSVASVATILCIIAGYFISQSLTKPIKQVVKAIEDIEEGSPELNLNLKNNDEIGFVANKFKEALHRLNFYYKRDLELQDSVRLAELRSLQAQINPHFLYNTLDSIKWLAKLNNVPEISIIVTELGKLLKSSMQTEKTETTLKETVELIKGYINIQLIRHEGHFDYNIYFDDAIANYKMPKLLIQPLVENAIVHGIEKSIEKVFINIKAFCDDDYIYIVVEDNGVGMDINAIKKKGNDIALKNIDKRIKLYYGDGYGVDVKSELGNGTVVTVTLPREVD